ncbi:hypothetical protein E9993_14890 [Labilibacter sediminis]|nr:hypothetical protein E9993_14890 [Labilibacter sediminis]
MKLRRIHTFLILLLIGSTSVLAQEKQDSIYTDTTYVLSGIANYLDIERAKWITVGTQYDFQSNALGIEISNGYDERPLIHFEDFSEDLVFKLNGRMNFNKDYSYGVNFGWKYPRYLSLIAIEFLDYNYSERNFQYKGLNINAETWIKNTDFVVMLKLGCKNLNDNTNFGVDIGLRNVLVPYKLYCGISGGYYFDYFTYSGFMQGFIYKNIVSVNLDYNRIEKFDFINLGLRITLKR